MLQDFLITLNSDWSETNMSLIVVVDLLAFDEAWDSNPIHGSVNGKQRK